MPDPTKRSKGDKTKSIGNRMDRQGVKEYVEEARRVEHVALGGLAALDHDVDFLLHHARHRSNILGSKSLCETY